MKYPHRYIVYANTANCEEYEMTIVGQSEEQAEKAAKVLCEFLGLFYECCVEKDW